MVFLALTGCNLKKGFKRILEGPNRSTPNLIVIFSKPPYHVFFFLCKFCNLQKFAIRTEFVNQIDLNFIETNQTMDRFHKLKLNGYPNQTELKPEF